LISNIANDSQIKILLNVVTDKVYTFTKSNSENVKIDAMTVLI